MLSRSIGLDPARGDCDSFANFFDPDGNSWVHRNGATAICDVWKLGDVDHARRWRNTEEESRRIRFSRPYLRARCLFGGRGQIDASQN